jgi:hypothetical protein
VLDQPGARSRSQQNSLGIHEPRPEVTASKLVAPIGLPENGCFPAAAEFQSVWLLRSALDLRGVLEVG